MIDSAPFDNYARKYDQWFDDHECEYALELKAIRELLPKSGKGVEIGAGTGRFSQPLGISLAIEPSSAMRSIAINRGVNIIAGTAESIPVEDGCYDYALLVTTVCFLKTPELAFREVYRILKTNSFIIVALIEKNSRLGKKYAAKINTSKFYKEANFHSAEEIQTYLQKVGFQKIDSVQAILPGDFAENYTQEIKPGFGQGSFVVLRAQK